MTRVVLVLLGLAAFILAVIWGLFKSSIAPTEAVLEDSKGLVRRVDIPFSEVLPENSDVLTYTAVIKYYPWSQNWIHIVPDNRLNYIEVNGENVSLASVDVSLLDNWETGFHFNLGRFLKIGTNIVKFNVTNYSGPTGLNILNSFRDGKRNGLIVLMLFPLYILLYRILRFFKFNKGLTLLILCGLSLRIIYFMITPYFIRGHDPGGHIEYVEYIADNMSIPASSQGFEFYHPPLYYVLSAAVYKLLSLGHILPMPCIYQALQIFSLLLSLGFMIVSVFIFQQLIGQIGSTEEKIVKSEIVIDKGFLVFMVSALFVFWPSNIINSSGIGNDGLLYLFYSIGLLFLIRWNRSKNNRDFYLSMLFGFLAMITKLNGIIIIAMIGIVLICRLLISNNKLPYIIKTVIIGIVCLIGIGITYRSDILDACRGKFRHIVIRNARELPQEIHVDNNINNYTCFDIKTFITKPFTDAWSDYGGRQYYWNFLLKTSLFGEFNKYPGKYSSVLGITVSIVLLILLVYIAIGMFIDGKSLLRNNAVIMLNIALLLAASVYNRISVPVSTSGDFRYITPALVSLCYFAGLSIVHFRKKLHIPGYIGYCLIAVFVTLNVLFFVSIIP